MGPTWPPKMRLPCVRFLQVECSCMQLHPFSTHAYLSHWTSIPLYLHLHLPSCHDHHPCLVACNNPSPHTHGPIIIMARWKTATKTARFLENTSATLILDHGYCRTAIADDWQSTSPAVSQTHPRALLPLKLRRKVSLLHNCHRHFLPKILHLGRLHHHCHLQSTPLMGIGQSRQAPPDVVALVATGKAVIIWVIIAQAAAFSPIFGPTIIALAAVPPPTMIVVIHPDDPDRLPSLFHR